MKLKQKIIYLFIFIAIFNESVLNTSMYDYNILRIIAKIIPRFIMMSSQKEKIKGSMEICILKDDADTLAALSLADELNKNYPNGIKSHTLNLLTCTYSEINKCENTQLIFMFNSSQKNIHNALIFSNKKNILTMSYDAVLLENGVEISLFYDKKVVPYINIKALSDQRIELDNVLLRISKFYLGKEN